MGQEQEACMPQAEPSTIEEKFEKLEEILKKLESGEGSLEEAFKGYESGMKLVHSLGTMIDEVEKRIQIVSEGEDHG